VISIYFQNGIQHYNGLSTDTRPVVADNSATFIEVDTKKTWIYDENNINPATEDNWWEI
jgi:hypothetical protein